MKKLPVYLVGLVGLGLVGITGCSSMQTKRELAADKSGAELWGENCQRCHNTPPPNVYSDDQWDVVMNHMRVRAHLSSEEAKKIVAFLKTANQQ